MKRTLATALILVSLLVPTLSSAGYEDLFEQVRAAAWAVYVRETGGMRAICSATAFRTSDKVTYLLTAGHCFLGADLRRTDFLVTQDHRRFVRAVLAETGLKPRPNTRAGSSNIDDYDGHDWAIILADIPNQPVIPVGNSDHLRVGEDIVIVGVPFGVDFLAVQGIVGSLDVSLSSLVWNHYYGANIYVAGGNSGSGVISTRQRAIVGIVSAGPGSQSSMMIFLPINLAVTSKQ